MSNVKVEHIGWHDDNIRVQDARRPFVRRAKKVLQVADMPVIVDFPSQQRMKAGIDTSSYYTYPLLFYTAFPDVSLAQLRSLSLCGSYLFDYILCLDSMLDHPTTCNAGAMLLGSMLQCEALSELYRLFPPGVDFWGYFNTYYDHFMQAILYERAWHHCLVRPYAEDELQVICAGKPALAKACIAALALLNGSEELIAPLTASHDAFYVGFQLFDDVQDWQLDYQRRHYTYLLTNAFQQAGWVQRVESDRCPEPAEVEDLLQHSQAIEQTLSLALAYLDKAERLLEGTLDGSWVSAIQQTRQRIREFRFGSSTMVGIPGDRWAPVLDWNPCEDAIIVPVAPGWLAWLDHARMPCISDTQILAAQQRVLSTLDRVSTVGEALCQVGLAVTSSCKLYPHCSLAMHVGMSQGELEWCYHNQSWLEAILALCLNEPVYQWVPGHHPVYSPFPGWVPPAVGRYLGYHLVEDYTNGTTRPHELTLAAVLDHFRKKLIA